MGIHKEVRTRFAPSPTGNLHIGGLRSALFNWLFAHHHKGTFLLRIEDTDLERSKPEYTQSIIDSLQWTGIESAEPIVIQSERFQEHTALADRLLAEGNAYRCFCSPQDLIDRLKTPQASEAFIQYDGFCYARRDQAIERGRPFVVRFRLPDQELVSWDDLIRGHISFQLSELEDFIILRSDGRPMYNFVVVADDVAMRISHVIRGEEHISNTAKQLLLYQACNYEIPQFAHLPLILGPSGDKLSKRDGATSAIEYKNLGYLPDALINYLARLGWSHGDQEIFTRAELIEFFSLEAVGKKGAIFDHEKLGWVNSVYIRQMSGVDIFDYILKNMDPDIQARLQYFTAETIIKAIELYQERVTTLRELITELDLLHTGPTAYNQDDLKKWIEPKTAEYLSALEQMFEMQPFTLEAVTEQVKQLSKELGIKIPTLLQPLRIALIGKSSGPGVYELLTLIGKKESIKRIQLLREVII